MRFPTSESKQTCDVRAPPPRHTISRLGPALSSLLDSEGAGGAAGLALHQVGQAVSDPNLGHPEPIIIIMSSCECLEDRRPPTYRYPQLGSKNEENEA